MSEIPEDYIQSEIDSVAEYMQKDIDEARYWARKLLTENAALKVERDALKDELMKLHFSETPLIHTFMGKPITYWRELEARAKELGADKLLEETLTLKVERDAALEKLERVKAFLRDMVINDGTNALVSQLAESALQDIEKG